MLKQWAELCQQLTMVLYGNRVYDDVTLGRQGVVQRGDRSNGVMQCDRGVSAVIVVVVVNVMSKAFFTTVQQNRVAEGGQMLGEAGAEFSSAQDQYCGACAHNRVLKVQHNDDMFQRAIAARKRTTIIKKNFNKKLTIICAVNFRFDLQESRERSPVCVAGL